MGGQVEISKATCKALLHALHRGERQETLPPQVHAKPKTAPEQVQYIADWISSNHPEGESGIVYCLTRKDTEQLAVELSQHGLSCGCYHADMDPHQREAVHMEWSSGIGSKT